MAYVSDSIVKDNATGATAFKLARGAKRYVLHVHVDAVGLTPSATVRIEGVVFTASVANTVAVTAKVIGTTTVTATGDTYVEVDSFPYDFVRVNVSANTNVNLEAKFVGV